MRITPSLNTRFSNAFPQNAGSARGLAVVVFFALLGSWGVTGCKSAADWREDADVKAGKHLGAAQKAVTGKEEKVVIETPGDTLRRRLLLDQNLLVLDKASLGIRDLPETQYWNGEKRLLPGDPADGSRLNTSNAVVIGLSDALKIAARNSGEYQTEKEALFTSALALDLENQKFRTTFSGLFSSSVDSTSTDGERTTGYDNNFKLGAAQVFQNGTEVASSIAVDLAGMLTGEKDSDWGIIADASISIPLLRGSGKLVTQEPLTQAQRDLVYAVRAFEQYKRTFMVGIADSYLGVLLAKRTMLNEEENYKRVIISTRRSRRMADANRMALSDFDQSRQSELSARDSWISACQSYESALETFKILIGLPPDAKLALSDTDLTDLQVYVEKFAKTGMKDYDAGAPDAPMQLEKPESLDDGELKDKVEGAIKIAFENRPDFRSFADKVEDAQRHVAVAEDGLRAEVTLGGTASVGETASVGGSGGADSAAGSKSSGATFKMSEGKYGGTLNVDLPFERTAERNTYRQSLIQLEGAVRAYQGAEDALKQSVRSAIRTLRETREQLKIQFMAVSLAERRVSNNDLLFQAGRAEMRDVLEAQSALLSAQNSLFGAIKGYRMRELELQKELGVLNVTIDGVWKESDLDAMKLWNSQK